MLTKTKIALAAAIVLSTAFAASAATQARVTGVHGSATSNMIPGYNKDGQTVGIENPDQR